MYQLAPHDSFMTGVVFGTAAGLALVFVPALRRLILAAVFIGLAWGLYKFGPERLGGELLHYARLAAAQGSFIRGALIGKGAVVLLALMMRRRAN